MVQALLIMAKSFSEAHDAYRGIMKIDDATIEDLEAFPFDEKSENKLLGKAADIPLEGIMALQKRCVGHA